MKTIKIAILCLLVASCAWAQDTSAVSFRITALTPSVKTGKAVQIKLTVVNESDHTITYRNTSPYCNYSFRVTNSSGVQAPETDFIKQLGCGSGEPFITGRNIIVTLKPGESAEESVRLTEYVDLSQPGQYSVQAFRTLPDIGKVSSNVVSVEVTP